MKMLKILLFSLVISTFGLAANAQQSSLGDTLGAFNAGILTPTPDRGLSGLAFIDGHYYLSGFDPDGGYVSKIYKISGDGQQLISFWSYPGLIGGIKGLAYDGDFLYGAGMNAIYQINFQTGMVTDTIPSPLYYASGLVYDPDTDHFWVSGDGNQLYEIERNGNIVNVISFIADLPTAGLAWDTWSVGGPYLWVWSMLYESDDVRPKAYQIKASTGQFTGVTFLGITTSPFGTDQALSLFLSDEIVEDKVAFAALHGSNFQSQFDGLDWVVLYDLDPEGTGVPGPIVNVSPTFIQNVIIFNDSLDVPLTIFNLSDEFDLSWFVTLEYPGMENDMPGEAMLDFNLTELSSPIADKGIRSVAFLNDHFYVSTLPGFSFDPALIYKISSDGTAIVRVDTVAWTNYGGTALTSDGEYLYASAQYYLLKFDPETMEVLDIILNTNFYVGAMAFDAQSGLFYLANGNVVRTIDNSGQEVNFYQTDYNIKGLSWDKWSPGGPYLWAYTQTADGIKAVRLNPSTGFHTGVEFDGLNLGTDTDIALNAFVTPNWQQDKLTMLALNRSNLAGAQPNDLTDHIIVYDLDATPAPGWIGLVGQATGTTAPLATEEVTVRLNAIMEDTLMTANIVINNNSVANPRLVVPVSFFMEADGTAVGIVENPFAANKLVRSIYPNPAADKVSLVINQLDVSLSLNLYNNIGKRVQSFMIEGQEQAILDVSTLKQGIYVLMVSDGTKTEQHKLIIR